MTPTSPTTIFIAHRGESIDAPENSMASIRLAWQRNVDAVEIDVRLTKDNHIVVMHDRRTRRTCENDLIISNSTLDQLHSFYINDKNFPEEKIPTLANVLIEMPKGSKLIVEVKSDRKIIPYLKKEIEKFSLDNNTVEFICFSHQTLCELKFILPDYKMYWIVDLHNLIRKLFPLQIEKIIKKSVSFNFDGLNLSSGININADLVSKLKSAGLNIYIWTVNDLFAAENFYSMGVNGITSDCASWLKKNIGGAKKLSDK